MDQFNGYNGYERRLYCSPATDRRLSRGARHWLRAASQPGYTRSLGLRAAWARSTTWWTAAPLSSDIEAYYKDEVILGWEWQFSQNWAIKADAIWWEVDNLIGSTTQLAENPANGRLTVFFLTANHDDYPKILNAIREAASPANRAAWRRPRCSPATTRRTATTRRCSSSSTAASPTTGRSTPT